MKKVKLKTHKEFKDLLKKKKLEILHTSDDGEVTYYGTMGNPSKVLKVNPFDYGKEYQVVNESNPISKEYYEFLKDFFNE